MPRYRKLGLPRGMQKHIRHTVKAALERRKGKLRRIKGQLPTSKRRVGLSNLLRKSAAARAAGASNVAGLRQAEIQRAEDAVRRAKHDVSFYWYGTNRQIEQAEAELKAANARLEKLKSPEQAPPGPVKPWKRHGLGFSRGRGHKR